MVSLSWINLFQLLLAFLSTLLGSYIFASGRSKALAVFFLCLALHNVLKVGLVSGMLANWPDMTHLFRFLYAPLVYFTVQELLYRDFRYQPRHALHLLPLGFALVLSLVGATPQTLGSLVALVMIGYLAGSYRSLAHFDIAIASNRSSGTPTGANWLRGALHLFSALIVFELVRHVLGIVIPGELYENLHLVFISTICVILTVLVFRTMSQPMLLPPVDTEEQALVADARPRQDRAANPDLESLLAEFMAREKPYLNPQLTVRDLATAMDVPARSLSEVINDAHRCNFSEFINKARVDEARGLMADGKGRTLLDIGLAAGFNSKTSFNVMFKRFTGQTPSEYRKQPPDDQD